MKKTIKLFGKVIDVVVMVEDGLADDDHLVNQEQGTETASSSRASMPPRRARELPHGARWILEKRLEASDVASSQSRFLFPIREEIMQVLTEPEVMLLNQKEALKVTVVDCSQRCFDMNLKRWPSANKYALNSGWNKLVDDNHLKKGDVVEFWGYRQDGLLRFAMNICKRRNISVAQH